jgi:hypothetical protein
MVTSGKVKIEVNQRYALKDAAKAQADLEARKTTGSTDPAFRLPCGRRRAIFEMTIYRN